MGDVGNFLFGGSKQKNSSNQQSQSTSSSQNQSTSSQGSTNVSQQQSASGSTSSNRAYDPLSASLTSSLGYVTNAGNMLGALLGLPQSTFSYATPPVPSSAPMPNSGQVNMSNLQKTLGVLQKALPTSVAPAPSSTPVTPPSTTPPPFGSGGEYHNGPGVPSQSFSGLGGLQGLLDRQQAFETPGIAHREMGGPVTAGQPYIVGEKRPEVFVPHQSGHIMPSVPQGFATAMPSTQTPAPTPAAPPSQYSGSTPYNPNPGSPTDAVNQFANSAGMDFIRDQGQKAISGASAANGVFNSGATGQALTQFGQNIGKTYLDSYMNHLLDYAKLGLGSASALSGAGGTNVSQSAQSSGAMGSSYGNSQSTGSSTGLSTSIGTASGSGDSKKGLVPDILG